MPQRQPQPLAITPALPSELLTYILSHQTYPTTLLICQSRANFLSSLQRCMPNTVQRQPPLYVEQSLPGHGQNEGEPVEFEPERQGEREAQERQRVIHHPLLVATLHQIVASRFVNLVFIPTLSHLRAYLAVFSGEAEKGRETTGEGPPKQKFEKMSNRSPLLVVYGLVALHRDTSEWSAQGLGISVAALVEAGWRGGRGVVVIEEREWDADGNIGGNYSDGGEGRESRTTGWEERLPMLNGSVKRIGLESEDGGWSGRTVEVGRVLGRWFRFEKGDWAQEN
ncbi:hypothetical protein ONS95_014511 [Cadophora gregata]|uniref:uncharacterized protein n=1 Tax=Cadophora gregata TaxID=51156 RepID=UPI0026DC2F8D|nr:uncharacterized protein ONS95_014511 [Cadophora gregata]KAK0112778.1 hypothetical protein ONS95_014511 [Cadophora gregata]KAK0124969.1 hypothetical protein ONS96_008839 [Cadophora gregata f. sp. sojae]